VGIFDATRQAAASDFTRLDKVVVMDRGGQGLLRRRRTTRNAPAARTHDGRSLVEGDAFRTTVRYNGTAAMVAVGGDLDPATAPLLGPLIEAIVGLGQRHVVVDVSDVAFIDGAGLRAMESLAELPTVTLIRFSAPVQRLVTQFSINPHLRDASASLDDPAGPNRNAHPTRATGRSSREDVADVR
jgi:anti-anti-sigma factor